MLCLWQAYHKNRYIPTPTSLFLGLLSIVLCASNTIIIVIITIITVSWHCIVWHRLLLLLRPLLAHRLCNLARFHFCQPLLFVLASLFHSHFPFLIFRSHLCATCHAPLSWQAALSIAAICLLCGTNFGCSLL